MIKNTFNPILRFFLEIFALVIFALWGWQFFPGWQGIGPALLIPLLFAGLWGIFAVKNDPSRSGKTVIPTRGMIRLAMELILFGLATLALIDLKKPYHATIFGLLVVFHYALSFDRIRWLLKQ